MSKRKELPEFDPLAGEGESTQVSLDSVHVPLSPTVDREPEGTIVGEYRLDHLYPDFFQSRGGVLPRALSIQLQEGKIDQRQALASWRKHAAEDEVQGKRYSELGQLKESIRLNGLINPIHIVRAGDREGYTVLCGERRYWAYWLLNEELKGYDRIPAKLHRDHLRFVQIAENEDVEPLSTVSKVRQTALAYLELIDIRPQLNAMVSEENYWGFFRQALKNPEELSGQSYRPRGLWKGLSERLGLHRTSLINLLNILKLPDEALDLADLWGLGQRQLEAVSKAPAEIQHELVEAAIALQISGTDLSDLVIIANDYGVSEYRKALSDLRKSKTISRPEARKARTQRPAVERHSLQVIKAAEAAEKYARGEYGQIARLIVGNRPEQAAELARTLSAIAKAIRDELRQE